jgi:hypothetical protein
MTPRLMTPTAMEFERIRSDLQEYMRLADRAGYPNVSPLVSSSLKSLDELEHRLEEAEARCT